MIEWDCIGSIAEITGKGKGVAIATSCTCTGWNHGGSIPKKGRCNTSSTRSCTRRWYLTVWIEIGVAVGTSYGLHGLTWALGWTCPLQDRNGFQKWEKRW